MIATLFLAGTLWFWLLLTVALISITALIENDNDVWADVIFVATLVVLYKMGNQSQILNIFNWITQHWFYSLLIFLGYFVAGTLYSMVKWAIYVSDAKAKILHDKPSYLSKSVWLVSDNKSRITHWMIYWPISGLWTLISNPVVKIFNRIFQRLEGVYQKISDKIMKEVVDKYSEDEKVRKSR